MTDQGPAPDRIRLTGISATGYHGVFDHERREGQTFIADVTVELDTRRAAATDDLTHTLDYGALAAEVVAVLRGEPADLIETVAERIAATVLAHPQAVGVEVTVHKPQAPIEVTFSDVEVRVRRDRGRLPAAEPLRADAEPWVPTGVAGQVRSADAGEPDGAADAETSPGMGAGGMAGVADAVPVPGVVGPELREAPVIQEPGSPFPPVFPTDEQMESAAEGRAGDGPESASGIDPAAAAVAGMLAAGAAGGSAAGTGDTTGVIPAGVPAAVGVVPAPTDATAGPASGAGTVVPHAGAEPGTDEHPPLGDQLDAPPQEPAEVVLALGSNLGAAQDTLRDAVRDLSAVDGLEVVEVSALARTAPVGDPEQPDYLNAVLIARTTLAPRELLRATSRIELEHGRERTAHWGPRTLDIDIIAFGALSVVTDDLELPHPRAHERAFVLQPWAQIQPDAVLHGLGGGPVAQLAATAPDREGVRWLALDWMTAPQPGAPTGTERDPEGAVAESGAVAATGDEGPPVPDARLLDPGSGAVTSGSASAVDSVDAPDHPTGPPASVPVPAPFAAPVPVPEPSGAPPAGWPAVQQFAPAVPSVPPAPTVPPAPAVPTPVAPPGVPALVAPAAPQPAGAAAEPGPGASTPSSALGGGSTGAPAPGAPTASGPFSGPVPARPVSPVLPAPAPPAPPAIAPEPTDVPPPFPRFGPDGAVIEDEPSTGHQSV